MERKQERPEGRFGEAAAAMAATATLSSLLHRLAQGCAAYLGLARLCDYYCLKAPAATLPQQDGTVSSDHELQAEEKEEFTVVEEQSRSMAFRGNGRVDQGVRDGGIKY